jgi:hypothetical protein
MDAWFACRDGTLPQTFNVPTSTCYLPLPHSFGILIRLIINEPEIVYSNTSG